MWLCHGWDGGHVHVVRRRCACECGSRIGSGCGCGRLALAGLGVGLAVPLLNTGESLPFGVVSLLLCLQLCTVSSHSSLLCSVRLCLCLCCSLGGRLLCRASITSLFPFTIPLCFKVGAQCAHVVPAPMFVCDQCVLHLTDHSDDATFTGHALLLRRGSEDATKREDAGKDSRECIGVSTLYKSIVLGAVDRVARLQHEAEARAPCVEWRVAL